MKINYKIIGFIFLTSILLSNSSCMLLLGVKTKPKWQTDKGLINSSEKRNIPTEFSYYIDTVELYNNWKEFYTEMFEESLQQYPDSTEFKRMRNIAKDDMQPVQFRLFDKTGQEIFKIVNCYVDKPIRADWNVEGAFNTFPPKIDYPDLNVHNLSLEFFLSTAYQPFTSKKVSEIELPESDYYGVIIWSGIFDRYSKKLIKLVQKKMKESGESITLLYLSNHNSYIWLSTDDKSREKIKTELEKLN